MHRHRMASWWIRWEDLNWPNDDNLERIKIRADKFAEADVSAAMIFGAHFRWDFLPVFPLLHDHIAAIAEELHARGVKLFDHHSVNLVHRYSTREEMRRVMRDSGPHLPFSPTFEAAATWEYKGKRLNDWRMIDVQTGEAAYLPQYTAQCFCHENPEYRSAYLDYARTLIADTGIDGLSADDALHYKSFATCGCVHCREKFRNLTGRELPPVEDGSFWGNWDNPDWRTWCLQRLEASAGFYGELAASLPEGFMLTGCGSNSAGFSATPRATDARRFARGWNYINMEMSGNTPPYKHDPKTLNVAVPMRLTNASHHQAVARDNGVAAFCTGFAHTTVAADHVWAVSKFLGSDAWIITLKPRLGLPDHILSTLPNEEDIVGHAFSFEKKHPELFRGVCQAQLGVYFSENTRINSLYGSLSEGYPADYSRLLTELFRAGITPNTVFSFPETPEEYPVIIVSGAAVMTEQEKQELEVYRLAGGKVIVLGPTALEDCRNSWQLPNRVILADPSKFFNTVPDGVHTKIAAWQTETPLPECADPDEWSEPREGLFYHPHRIGDGAALPGLLERCRRYGRPMPLQVEQAKGYMSAVFRDKNALNVHFLAEDYDVDIDHGLDEIRKHRSRVNFVNHVEPAGVDGILHIRTEKIPQVYTPFCQQSSRVEREGEICVVTLPPKCSYAILRFED